MSERLTERNEIKGAFEYVLKDKSDAEVGYFKDYDAFYSHRKVVDRLGAYEELEEQGLLLRLPCKVGDTLYKVHKRPTKCTMHGEYRDDYACQGCEELECDSSYCWDIYVYKPNIKEIVCISDEIGKTIFLTQSEAEEKLRELEEK